MKKLIFLLLFVQHLSFGQNSMEDNIDPFKELISKPTFGGPVKSFFKGAWIDYNGIVKLAENIFGMTVFKSGHELNGYFCFNCNPVEGEFGYYNPSFLGELIKTVKSISPKLKTVLMPLYFEKFDTPLRKLMENQIEYHFTSDCNRHILERIKNKDDIKEILFEIYFGIENNCDEISNETLFWIRRDYDGTSKQFLELFNIIIDIFYSEELSLSSQSNINNSIWTNGFSTVHIQTKKKIKINDDTKLRGYVFDGFLNKDYKNFNLHNDKGYFIWFDSVENQKNIRGVNAESGLNVRDNPSTSGKIIGKLANGVLLNILNKTNKTLTINDIDKKTGDVIKIKGNWVEVETYYPSNGFSMDNMEVNQKLNLECHMCESQFIKEKSRGKVVIVKGFQGDFGDSTQETHSFTLINDELYYTEEYINGEGEVSELKTKWIPLNSDPTYLENIMKFNRKSTEVFKVKKDQDDYNQRLAEELDYEFDEMEDEKRHFIYEKPPIVDPISASDFYQLGMINTISRDGMYNVPEYNDFNPNKLKAIEYFDKSIELDPNYYPSFFMRGLTKYSINQNDGCDDIKKALSFKNFMSPATAQKFLKENCN
tara:strand:- start:6731 stop:8518 length:1788 start_codon:yes stop_codon:yes gene_type:complete